MWDGIRDFLNGCKKPTVSVTENPPRGGIESTNSSGRVTISIGLTEARQLVELIESARLGEMSASDFFSQLPIHQLQYSLLRSLDDGRSGPTSS